MFMFLTQHSPLFYLTQSVWRDEVYSILMAAKPIPYFFQNLSFEPPFYYLLLHFWMKIAGQSEVAARSLSLLALGIATVIVIEWASKVFKNHWLAWWLPLFFFFNPMLIYYGIEIRTYGWYILFTVLSLWAYMEERWVWWTIATVLGFYTHSYFIIVPFAQTIHYLFTHRKHFWGPFVKSALVAALFILPWSIRIVHEMTKLRQSWYFPVDGNLVTSVLGNLFLGYEGTPGGLWMYTKILSAILVCITIAALVHPKNRKLASLMAVQMYVPLAVVIGISFMKPLYVNRYVIPVTVAEVFLTGLAIYAIKNPILQKIAATIAIIFVFGFNWWYPTKHAKLDIRSTIREIQTLKTKSDVIMTDNPLVMFETMYYSGDPAHVYLYNPQHSPFPWYIGEGLVSPSQIVDTYPPYPMRAFVVHGNATYDIVYTAPFATRPQKRPTL